VPILASLEIRTLHAFISRIRIVACLLKFLSFGAKRISYYLSTQMRAHVSRPNQCRSCLPSRACDDLLR